MESKDITEKPILTQQEDGSLIPVQHLASTLRIFAPDTSVKLKRAYETDTLAQQFKSQQPDNLLFQYKKKVYLPEACMKEIIHDHHDDKTMELLGRTYAAPRLRMQVEQYIKECV